MNHKKYEKWLVLDEYGELGPADKKELENHCVSCQACRSERDRLNRLQHVLSAYHPAAVTDSVIDNARQALRSTIRREGERTSIIDRLVTVAGNLLSGFNRPVLAGAITGIAGLIAGYFLFTPRGSVTNNIAGPSPILPGDTRIANVRFITTDLSTGNVEFTFDAVKPVRVRGNINDEQVQKILTHALLTEENPGVRLQSVNTFAAFPGNRDKDIKSALITSLKTDENAGVRNEALKTLRNYPMDNDIKLALLYTLNHDRNPGIRIAAINYLDSARVSGAGLDRDVLEVFRERMKLDDNNYIRIRAKAAIQEMNQ